MSMDHAWGSLQKQIPSNFLQDPLNLPLADKVAAMIFIGCGLSIAYLFELERQGIQLVSIQEAQNVIDSFKFDPMNGLHQTSLNVQSLLEDGSKDIINNYANDEEHRDERIFQMMMDVVEELPIAPASQTLKQVWNIYHDVPVVRTFIDIGS